MQEIPGMENINGHIMWVHGGYGFVEKNKIGEIVLDFMSAYELAIVNIYF